jgi:hypothetical protein
MKKETFDIFSGGPNTSPLWLECVEGFANAKARMEQIAAKHPGQYFLFSTRTHSRVAQIETFPESQQGPTDGEDSNAVKALFPLPAGGKCIHHATMF